MEGWQVEGGELWGLRESEDRADTAGSIPPLWRGAVRSPSFQMRRLLGNSDNLAAKSADCDVARRQQMTQRCDTVAEHSRLQQWRARNISWKPLGSVSILLICAFSQTLTASSPVVDRRVALRGTAWEMGKTDWRGDCWTGPWGFQRSGWALAVRGLRGGGLRGIGDEVNTASFIPEPSVTDSSFLIPDPWSLISHLYLFPDA